MGGGWEMKMDADMRLIVALDLPSRDEITGMFETLFPTVKFFKLGLEAYSACGPSIVRTIKDAGGFVFLDLKFHDIPITVHRACLAALRLGADIVNLHASGGGVMMREAARAREIWFGEVGRLEADDLFPAIIGVTLLTHIGGEEYDSIFGSGLIGPAAFVEKLALMARDSGLQGVVSSGQEARAIRERIGDDFLIVTPGVRPTGSDSGGHQRKVTPSEAFSNGSDMIVVGRPVTGATNPPDAAKKILEEIAAI
jgi:orotidine-5'-phosphate decarboxylase